MGEYGSLVVVTPPVGEPIGLVDTKAWARITGVQDDDLLGQLITTARQHFDGPWAWFQRALFTQTWDYFLPSFPIDFDEPDCDYLIGIRVPLPPLQSVTSVKYLDVDGVLQTISASDYVVDTARQPGRITPAPGKAWPTVRATTNAVTIRFVAGYGAKVTDVPQDIRAWLRQAVAFLYENREAPTLPLAFLWSLARYKVDWKF